MISLWSHSIFMTILSKRVLPDANWGLNQNVNNLFWLNKDCHADLTESSSFCCCCCSFYLKLAESESENLDFTNRMLNVSAELEVYFIIQLNEYIFELNMAKPHGESESE